jgi:hypothetical protein
METSFIISLGITFVLLLLLIYHFKQRLTVTESKQDTMFEIINNLAQELNNMKMGISLMERPPTPYPHNHISTNHISIQSELEDMISENADSDDDYDSDDDSDSDVDSDSDDDDKIVVSDEDDNEDNISVEEIRPGEDINDRAESLVVDILENIQTNTQEPEIIKSDQIQEPQSEKPDFNKMNLGTLKNYITEQGWVQDASKMKKAQILSLIQEHQ